MSNKPESKEYHGIWYHSETPWSVVTEIHKCYHNDYPVRIWYGDTEYNIENKERETHIGRSWGDEWGVIGRIGRSTGSQKIPLLVEYPPEGDGYGGGALLDHCIIRIDAFYGYQDIKGPRWVTMYQHELFSVPEYVVDWEVGDKMVKVLADGTHVASFKQHLAAYLYIAFMSGLIHERAYTVLETEGD